MTDTIDSFWFAIRPETLLILLQLSMFMKLNVLEWCNAQTSRDTNSKDYSFTEVTVAKVVLMARSIMSERSLNPVNMPVGLGKSVRFANADEIKFALGIPEMSQLE